MCLSTGTQSSGFLWHNYHSNIEFSQKRRRSQDFRYSNDVCIGDPANMKPCPLSSTPNGRSHTNNLPPMELRPPSAKKSHTQNASPWNSGQNSKMIQTPKLRDIQNTMEHKSHPPRTRYPFYNNSNGIAS